MVDSSGFNFVVPFDQKQKLPIIDAKTSTGPFVLALLDEEVGTKLLAYDSHLSMGEDIELWSKVSGPSAGYQHISGETLLAQGVPCEVVNGFEALAEFGYMSEMKYIEPSQLKKKTEAKSFESWLKEQKWGEILETIQAGKGEMRKGA